MQKVTYVNAYGESVVFGREPPVVLNSVSGFSRPDGQIVRTQGAYQAGESVQRVQLPSRSVQVKFEIPPCADRASLYRERMRLERVLAAGRSMKDGQTGALIYENDVGRFVTGAVPDGTVAYGKRLGHALAGNAVSFLCPDAYLRDEAERTAQMAMGMDSFTLPAKLPVRLGSRRFEAEAVNEGTADAALEITLYGTGETPKVVNHTTGAQIVVSRVIATGERLLLNTDPGALSCVLERADGTREDAFGYLDPATAVSAFVLAPGTNRVEYVPSVVSTGSRLELRWHSTYEGV